MVQPLYDILKRPNTCGKKVWNKEVKNLQPPTQTQIDVRMVMAAENNIGNTPETLRDVYKETMTSQLYEETAGKIMSNRLSPPKKSNRLNNRSRMSISSK